VLNGAGTCPHTHTIVRLEKDMYHGNGKPGMTTRMEVMEGIVADIKNSLRWIVRLLVATFLTGVAGVIVAIAVRR